MDEDKTAVVGMIERLSQKVDALVEKLSDKVDYIRDNMVNYRDFEEVKARISKTEANADNLRETMARKAEVQVVINEIRASEEKKYENIETRLKTVENSQGKIPAWLQAACAAALTEIVSHYVKLGSK